MAGGITNDRIYKLVNEGTALTSKLVNDTRLELKGDIGDLRRQFETLEAGRLTRAEGHINDLRMDLQKISADLAARNKENTVAVSNISNKFVMIGGAILVMFTTIIDTIIQQIVKSIKL